MQKSDLHRVYVFMYRRAVYFGEFILSAAVLFLLVIYDRAYEKYRRKVAA